MQVSRDLITMSKPTGVSRAGVVIKVDYPHTVGVVPSPTVQKGFIPALKLLKPVLAAAAVSDATCG